MAARYLAGRTQAEIGRELAVSQQTISRDLDALRQEWQASAQRDTAVRIAEEMQRIDALERVAWQAWERSCQDEETLLAETVRGRVGTDGQSLPDLAKTRKTVRGQAGDPRFLDRIAWCIETRLRLAGALRADSQTQTQPIVTVVAGIDLAAVLGARPGLPHERPAG